MAQIKSHQAQLNARGINPYIAAVLSTEAKDTLEQATHLIRTTRDELPSRDELRELASWLKDAFKQHKGALRSRTLLAEEDVEKRAAHLTIADFRVARLPALSSPHGATHDAMDWREPKARPPSGGPLVLVRRLCTFSEFAAAPAVHMAEDRALRASLERAIASKGYRCLAGAAWTVEVERHYAPLLAHVRKPAYQIHARSVEEAMRAHGDPAHEDDGTFRAMLGLAAAGATGLAHAPDLHARLRVVLVPDVEVARECSVALAVDAQVDLFMAFIGTNPLYEQLPCFGEQLPSVAAEQVQLDVRLMVHEPGARAVRAVAAHLPALARAMAETMRHAACSASLMAFGGGAPRAGRAPARPAELVLDLAVRLPADSALLGQPELLHDYTASLRAESLRFLAERLGEQVAHEQINVMYTTQA